MGRTDAKRWGSRIGSWVVTAIGLALVLLIVGNWVEVIGRLTAPDLAGNVAGDGLLGPALFGAIGATVPFLAAIWGLWHLYRLLVERAEGGSVSAARRFRAMGVALMGVAVLLVAAGFGLGAMFGQAGAVLAVHWVVFVLGLVVFTLAQWRLWRDRG